MQKKDSRNLGRIFERETALERRLTCLRGHVLDKFSQQDAHCVTNDTYPVLADGIKIEFTSRGFNLCVCVCVFFCIIFVRKIEFSSEKVKHVEYV